MKIPNWQVIKVDGSIEVFESDKIADSIFLAAQDVGGTDRELASSLGTRVIEYLIGQFGRMKKISTRDIGDGVEKILMEANHVKTAKSYIVNRDRRREEQEAKIRMGIKDDVGLPLNSLVVMKNKYLQIKHQSSKSNNQTISNNKNPITKQSQNIKQTEQGEDEYETPGQAFDRVARALASVEKGKRNQQYWFDEFGRIMRERRMLPGGRTMANAGTVNNQLANCFVLPMPDDVEGIFEVVKESSILKKNGGGVGFSFGKVRPKGDRVETTSGKACGPVALMGILDHASEIFLQAGGRRSGNMVTLPVTHPDIFEFMSCKESGKNLPHINYSLAATSRFMKAAKKGDDWDLINPRTGLVTQRVSARSILEQAARLAWHNGDPGIIFVDRINADNPTAHVGVLETVNLCGEQPLLPYEACNLGSVNLVMHLKSINGRESTVGDYEFDWQKLEETVRISVRLLDDVVSICTYPLDKIDKVVKGNRKIGLGVMGWADALVRLGLAYDSKPAVEMARKVMKFIQQTAWDESEKLGREKGSFPNFPGSIWQKRKYKSFRNATTTTIAPTGSISMLAGCSYGIEPLFAVAFYKKVMGDYQLPEVNRDLVLALKRANGVYSRELMEEIAEHGVVSNIDKIPEKIRKVFVTAHEIAAVDHVKMQAAFQEFTDNAVSKTINLPSDARVEEVMEAYMLADELGCKGITVYRDRSRGEQVLNIGSVTVKTKNQTPKFEITKKKTDGDCPQCGGKLIMGEGCKTCPNCAFSVCSV